MTDSTEKIKKQFLRAGVVSLLIGLGLCFVAGLGWSLLAVGIVSIAWGLVLKNVIGSMTNFQDVLAHQSTKIKALEEALEESHLKAKKDAISFDEMSRKTPDFLEAYTESAKNQHQEIQSELIQIELLQHDAVDQLSKSFQTLGQCLEKHRDLSGGGTDVSDDTGSLFSMVHFESFVSLTERLLDEFVNTILNTSKSSMKLLEKLEFLEATMSEIRDDIGGIDTIAEQTQVLSINASIESARAGISGRGFGVVATEIGHLSVYSKTFGEKISAHIDAMQETIKEAGKSASDISFIDMGFAFAARRDIGEMTEKIETAKQKWQDGLCQLTCLNEDISSNADDAATALQFEDQTTQLFGSIKKRIGTMKTGLAQIGSHEQRFESEEKLEQSVESLS